MLVSLDFSVNSQEYRIERGRKPNVLRFYINNEHKAAEDEAQGDSRETQDAIERVMNMSHDMFRHVLALNTYTEPFLSLKANDQRTIIEQLLGITLLSERADAIKELNKSTKDAIQAEEFRIRAVQEANKRIEEQIESLRKRQRLWIAKRDEDVGRLEQAIADLEHINIDAEVQAHRDLEAFHVKKKALDDANRYIRQIDTEDAKLNKLLDKLKTEIAALDAHKCHSCGQDLHDDKQDELKQAKQALVQETALQLLANDTQRQGHEDTITQIGTLGTAPTVFYDSLEQALNHRNTVETLRKDLTSRQADADPYEEQISDMQGQALQVVSYDTLNELTRLQDHGQPDPAERHSRSA